MNTGWIKDYIFNEYLEKSDLEAKAKKYLDLKSQYMTKPLFKYCSFDSDDYNIDNFTNNVFYMQNPLLFNDPFDCNIAFGYSRIKQQIVSSLLMDLNLPSLVSMEYIQQEYNKRHKTNIDIEHNINSLNKDLPDVIRNIIENYIGVSCLSENKDSLLMWSHYADKHEGFCIEYDFSADSIDIDNNDLLSRINIFPVIYSIDRPNMSYIAHFDNFRKLVEGKIDNEIRAEVEYNLLFKSKEWEYEKEWRVLGNITQDRFCATPLPKAVYIGVKTKEENKSKIIEIATGKGIPVYQMKLSDSKYAFDEPELIG